MGLERTKAALGAAFTTGVALGIDEAKLLHVLNRAARDRTDPLASFVNGRTLPVESRLLQ